jgi:hypothetical protein
VRRQVVSLPLVAAVEDHVAHLALPVAHRLKQIMIKKVNVEKTKMISWKLIKNNIDTLLH